MRIIEFNPELAHHFKEINEEWISDMFTLEEIDIQVLSHPQEEIIDDGGHILFVESPELGIVGTGALLKTGEGEYELTKMGVYKKARGLHAGNVLLNALIQKAKEIGATNLYLLTNRDCAAAIHLYEKSGFRHDQETIERFGSQYERCNVAMRHFT